MFSYVQIFLCLLTLHHVSSKPIFGEIGFKKNFEVAFKPPPLPPLPPLKFGFLKEFWSPFGKFEMKHEIAKRDLDKMTTVEEEKEEPPVDVLPVNRYEVEELKVGPLAETGPIHKVGLMPNVGPLINAGPLAKVGPVPFPRVPVPAVTPMAPLAIGTHGPPAPHVAHVTPELGPVVAITPVPAPPRPPVVIAPPPKPKEPPTGLFTNIARDDLINEYLKAVEPILPLSGNAIVPEKPKNEPPVEEPVSPLVRGSRLAFYFGNILIEMLSQFLGGQRGQGLIDRPITI